MKFIAIVIVMCMLFGTLVIGDNEVTASSPGPYQYRIYHAPNGDTVARNVTSNVNDWTGSSTSTIITNAIAASAHKKILIENGTYTLTSRLTLSSTSLTGVGNATHLRASATVLDSFILITGDKVSVTDMQISSITSEFGNGAVRRAINFLGATHSEVQRVYIHDLRAGQGVYMSGGHHNYVNNTWIYNIGEQANVNYGSGIAFGEQNAGNSYDSSHSVVINNCIISGVTMSSIDIEPGYAIIINGTSFYNAKSWIKSNGQVQETPVITLYERPGWPACDYITVTNNNVYGAFGEFFYGKTNHTVIAFNHVMYTVGYHSAIYLINSHETQIYNNSIKTMGVTGIGMVNCNQMSVMYNRVTDLTGVNGDYAMYGWPSTGTSIYNVFYGNMITGFKVGIASHGGANYATVENNIFVNTTTKLAVTGTGNTVNNNEYGIIPPEYDNHPILPPIDPDPITDPINTPSVGRSISTEMIMAILLILATFVMCGIRRSGTFDPMSGVIGVSTIILLGVAVGNWPLWAAIMPVLLTAAMVGNTIMNGNDTMERE